MLKKSNGIGSITKMKRKNGWYYRGYISVGVDENGEPIRKSKCSYVRQEVVDWIKINNNKLISPNSEKSIGELAHLWLETVKKPSVATKSYEKYEAKIRIYIDPDPISEIIISEVTIEQLQYFINKIEREYGNNLAEQVLVIIRAIFNRLHDLGEIQTNYSKFIKLKTTKKTVGSRKKRPLTKQQRLELLRQLDTTDKIDLAIYISFFSGLRLGEVMGLTAEDIEFNQINVDKSWTRIEKARFGIKPPKNESSIRKVPIPIDAMKVIKENTENISGYIFSDDGTKPFNVNRIQRRINAISEIIGAKISFHSLRHTYATTLFEQGVEPKIVQTLLGHSSLATTMQIYVEVTNELQHESVQSLNYLA